MSLTASNHAAQVPELLLLIAKYLGPGDIASCMAACKAFTTTLRPRLWVHLILASKLPPRDTLLLYRRNTRTLTIDYRNPPKDRHVQGFLATLIQDIPNAADGDPTLKLHTIYMNAHIMVLKAAPQIAPAFIDIIRGCAQHLTTLTISISMFQTKGAHLALEPSRLLDSIPNLRELTFVADNELTRIKPQAVMGVLRESLKVRDLVLLQCRLHVSRTGPLNEFELWTEAVRQRIEDMGISKIRDLRLPLFEHGYRGFFINSFLTVQGPSLERMSIPYTYNDDYEALTETIERYCPNLRHLTMDLGLSQLSRTETAVAMIRGCRHTGLKSFRFHCKGTVDGVKDQGDIVSALIEHHADTLEVIEYDNEVVSSDDLYRILESFPNLKRMWIEPDPNLRVNSQSRRSIQVHSFPQNWACLDLKELSLTYYATPERTAPSIHLYDQIGLLVELESLAIGPTALSGMYKDDLTMALGSLHMLKGLKKLRRVYFSRVALTKIGCYEVDFMLREWPSLHTVSLECTRPMFDKIKGKEDWKRMCETKPWIQLVRAPTERV
ncbi:hypothetical protein BGX31_009937 [Mortierella sp. GBA43]|nr:hypothetical protein BGX31_009937 [Mortierella sp. GBA43]